MFANKNRPSFTPLSHILITQNISLYFLFSLSLAFIFISRRHSSIGPQERRSSAINLSPPTVSHTISVVECCFIVKHELCRHSKSMCLSSSPPPPPPLDKSCLVLSKFNELSSSYVVIIKLIFAFEAISFSLTRVAEFLYAL